MILKEAGQIISRVTMIVNLNSKDLWTRIFAFQFLASGIFTANAIKKRTLEYVFRTIYWLNNPAPKTLKEHLLQGSYVANEISFKSKITQEDYIKFDDYYNEYKDTSNYHKIFNFFLRWYSLKIFRISDLWNWAEYFWIWLCIPMESEIWSKR